jgi:hypothetical protein
MGLYAPVFWGNSPDSKRVFPKWIRVVRITKGVKKKMM